MAKVVDDEGKEIEVFTQEELDAQVAALKAQHEAEMKAAKEHQAEKLAEFEKAKAGATAAQKSAEEIANEAKKIAEEAKASIDASKQETLATKKSFWINSVTGGDPELTKKVLENYELLNMPVGTDAEIQARVQKAITATGIGSIANFNQSISYSGAQPANVTPTEKSIKEHNYEVWKNELQIQDLVPKKPNQ